MCTVSFYKDSQNVIITSNRDENIERPLAIPPQKITLNNTSFYYPLDPKANGSWFGVKQSFGILVLLNGADKKHISNPPYKKSRGLIFLEILKSDNFLQNWNKIELSNIEPFTLIAYENNILNQLIWNGIEKKSFELDTEKPHIWSSSTLYDQNIILKRKNWFYNFITSKNNKLNSNDFINFHKKTEISDQDNGLIINRNGKMLTKNITQCTLFENSFRIIHQDLILNEETILEEIY